MVSMIMPAYNGEKYIKEAILSIINQTYQDWELIIVDDGSTDNTVDIIKSFSDKRIRLYANKENMGIAYSTNYAIDLADGEYIALLDDDDIAVEDRLAIQVDYLNEHKDIDILGGRSIFIDGQGEILRYSGKARNNPYYIRAMLLFRCVDFMNGTSMIRKKFIFDNSLKYRNGFFGMQDYMFFVEASKIGRISSVDRFLLKSRIHETNETKHQFETNETGRRIKYDEIRRNSLALSGFSITEDELKFLSYSLPESRQVLLDKNEIKRFGSILQKLIRQGRILGIEYQAELEHICKSMLFEKIWKITSTEEIINRVIDNGS